jgi:hypothetical protein
MVYVAEALVIVGVPEITPAELIDNPVGRAGLILAALNGPSLVMVGDKAVIAVLIV